MPHPQVILTIAVVAFMAAAMFSDLKSRRIPNWLTVGAFALALVFQIATDGWAGLGFAMGGFAVGFGLLLILWLTGSGGGGDVKMMGALGAWLGAPLVLIVFVASGLVAFLAMVGVYVWRMLARAAAPVGGGSMGNSAQEMNAARRVIPYAVPATLATLAVLGTKLLVLFVK